MEPLRDKIIKQQKRLQDLKNKLNFNEFGKILRKLEVASMKPDFWKDEKNAKQVMREISEIQENIEIIEKIQNTIDENLKLIDLAKEESSQDAELEVDIGNKVLEIEKQLKLIELHTFLSGKFDKEDAIVSLHSGQGGTEAMDWAAMLLRMYTRFFERQNWKWELVAETAGEEAGIKSATLLVKGKYAYGFLKGEAGTHRLVRQSPFNADQLRQTSFALVEVLPRVKEPGEIELRDEDIEFHAFRSSGHGGQNVNKVSTAVRLKHTPSGITTECQTQRTQEQNRKIALELLVSKLWQKKQQEHDEKIKKLKGEHKIAGWGNQIRNYVLHPYHLVKDTRTKVETQNTEDVLNGKLEQFIDAQVRQLSH